MARTLCSRVLLLLLCLTLLLTVSASAQQRGVRGRVTDAAGAAVPGVSVTLLKDGAPIRNAISDVNGEFNLNVVDLSEGVFEVRLEIAGGLPGRVTLSREINRSIVTVGVFRAEVRTFSLQSAAAPRPPPPPPEITGPDTSTHAVVPVFYATDRNRIAYKPLSYGGEREPTKELHLGRFDVSVPRDHQPGQVERPTIWTLWREDPNRHFVIVKAAEQSANEFYQQLHEIIGKSERKEAFVFVHGYNVAFEAAVYRTAQIAYDLGFDGAPILYSWPSVADPARYFVDANNSEWTIDHLHWFLEDVAAKTGASYVHVIAHSRGNWPLMQALKTIATEPGHAPRPRFQQIILTAPDVDADTFRLLAQPVKTMGERTTLYASANDKALALSKEFQGYQRAGDVRPDIVVVPGLDSIDVSAVDTSFLGHSYVGDNTSVISDIARLLRTGWPPDRRCGLKPATIATSSFWMFVANAICPVNGM